MSRALVNPTSEQRKPVTLPALFPHLRRPHLLIPCLITPITTSFLLLHPLLLLLYIPQLPLPTPLEGRTIHPPLPSAPLLS
ncbi:unnamed protein product [Closterium sp. NIES-53]